MKKAIVIGTGGHSRVIISMLKYETKYSILAVLELNKYRKGEKILDCNVLQFKDSYINQFVNRSDVSFFFALGGNSIREEIFQKIRSLGLFTPSLISSHAHIDPSATLGIANVICAKAHIGPMVIVGNNNLINTGAIIEHESIIGDHCHIAPSATIAGRVDIKSSCFIGAGATIIENLSIATHTTLGAGSTLVRCISEANHLYAGVPAKKMRKYS
jgi:sugar O-acyltransferase (sialic acid O-acetyltransferase NeuD family)